MDVIRCGWCRRGTPDVELCVACGHVAPRQPWEQRGGVAPLVDEHAERIRDAELELRRQGRRVTVELLAEHLGVDARTVQRWRANVTRMSGSGRGDATAVQGRVQP